MMDLMRMIIENDNIKTMCLVTNAHIDSHIKDNGSTESVLCCVDGHNINLIKWNRFIYIASHYLKHHIGDPSFLVNSFWMAEFLSNTIWHRHFSAAIRFLHRSVSRQLQSHSVNTHIKIFCIHTYMLVEMVISKQAYQIIQLYIMLLILNKIWLQIVAD